MPANTSSRKSFTQRDYVRSSTDGVGIDLYSRQDTRMYHYLYARGRYLLTYARARTRRHTLELSNWKENSRTRYTECPVWTGIDLAYPIDTSGFSLPLLSRSLAIRNFTSGFKTHDAAISWPTMYIPSSIHYFFFPILGESWITRQAWDCHNPREEKQATRKPGDIFIPMLGNPLH